MVARPILEILRLWKLAVNESRGVASVQKDCWRKSITYSSTERHECSLGWIRTCQGLYRSI